jgi:hypothetical protein
MPARSFKTKLFEIAQTALMIASLVGVVEATRADTASAQGTTRSYVETFGRDAPAPDRRLADLARADRKRREDQHRDTRRDPEVTAFVSLR